MEQDRYSLMNFTALDWNQTFWNVNHFNHLAYIGVIMEMMLVSCAVVGSLNCVYSTLSIIACFLQFSLLDINECDSMDNGGCEHLCNNTIGSFFCYCILGYRLDENEFNCSGEHTPNCFRDKPNCMNSNSLDIDECEEETDNCHDNAMCENSFGSFRCTCNPGYSGDGVNCSSKLLMFA